MRIFFISSPKFTGCNVKPFICLHLTASGLVIIGLLVYDLVLEQPYNKWFRVEVERNSEKRENGF